MLIDFGPLSFLSISIVIYFHSQVLDGQRKIISLLQEQIENVRRPYLCVTISSVRLMTALTNDEAQFDESALSSSFSMLFPGGRGQEVPDHSASVYPRAKTNPHPETHKSGLCLSPPLNVFTY